MKCRICGVEKDFDDFYQSDRNRCKPCVREITKANRIAKLEYYRSYDRMRGSMPHRVAARKEYAATDAFRASHAASLVKWRAEHPKRRQAQTALGNALRDGRIKKLPCLVCGDSSEAHHPDYDRPLDVVWLCTKHHAETHKMANELRREQANAA